MSRTRLQPRVSRAVSIAVLTLSITACLPSDDSSTTPETTRAVGPTTTGANAAGFSGVFFGFVSMATESTLTIDLADLLTGDAALEAAAAAGDSLETEFYISNPDPSPATFPLDPAADISVQVLSGGLPIDGTVTIEDFVQILAGTYTQAEIYGVFPEEPLPMNVVFTDGFVTGAHQVYFP